MNTEELTEKARLTGKPRTFTAYRRLDISATHDENQRNNSNEPQYEGVVFSDGKCAIRWLTAKRSVSVWESYDDMFAIHGHPEFGTEIVWNDEAQLNKLLSLVVKEAVCPECNGNKTFLDPNGRTGGDCPVCQGTGRTEAKTIRDLINENL